MLFSFTKEKSSFRTCFGICTIFEGLLEVCSKRLLFSDSAGSFAVCEVCSDPEPSCLAESCVQASGAMDCTLQSADELNSKIPQTPDFIELQNLGGG